jgi:hypothetical protein
MVSTNVMRRYPWQFPVLLLASLVAVFALHSDYLHRGLQQDDYYYVGHYSDFSVGRLLVCFNPVAIHWFYRPILLSWFLVFGGLAPHNPVALHAGSLVLFGLTVYFFGALIYRLTGRAWAGLLAACLFLFAPRMQEAVSWVCCASTLMAALFSILTLHYWMTFRERSHTGYFVLALLTMAAAMCSKEDAATLPLIAGVFDLYLHQRFRLPMRPIRLLAAWTPVIVWTILYGVLDITAYRIVSAERTSAHLWQGISVETLRILGSFGARTLLFSVFGQPASQPFNPGVLLVGVFALIVVRARKNPLILCGTAMALLAILPVPLASGGHALSERFNYLPNLYAVLLATQAIATARDREAPVVRALGSALLIDVLLTKLPIPSIDPFTDWILLISLSVAAGVVWWKWRMSPHGTGILARRAAAFLVGAMSLLSVVHDLTGMNDILAWFLLVAIAAVYGAGSKPAFPHALDGVATAFALTVAMPYSVLAFFAWQLVEGRSLEQLRVRPK